MIDNLQIIKSLLNFENKGDFYQLIILKRKKDQPQDQRDSHQSVRTIKTYCIESIEHLEKRYDEIKQLCEMFKARAYIHVQKQNHSDVSLNMMIDLAQRIKDGQHNQKNLFDSVVGQIKTKEKRWIVDIDTKDLKYLRKVIEHIDKLEPIVFKNLNTGEIESKIEATIPTKNGYHLITKKFDMLEFKKKYPEIDVQKKNPTLLFLPNSLN